jgi:hypothetical protein
MSEFLSSEPEREQTEEEMKRAEAAHIAELTGTLQRAFRREISAQDAGDWALDDVHWLVQSIAKRDPEFGRYIVDAMEAHEVASTDPHPVDDLRETLGMPVEYTADHEAAMAEHEAWKQEQAALAQKPQSDLKPPADPSPEHRK